MDSINKGFGSIKVILPSLPHKQILLLQEQFNVSPHEIGLVYVFSNLFMFITESIITPLASRLFCPFSLVLLSLTLLTAGKLFQLFVHSLFGSFFAITFSPQYVLFCVCCNTIGEEIFATTFVNVLSQVAVASLDSQVDLASSADRSVSLLLRRDGVYLPSCGTSPPRKDRHDAGISAM